MREWWAKFHAMVARRRRIEDELREEMDTQLEMEIQENLAKGMASAEAQAAARRDFGNRTQIQERSREVWGSCALETVLQDLRYALRTMRRSPGFSVVVVLSLALGIGANTAIFSVVDALLFRTLPVGNPQQLVMLKRTYQGDGRAPYGFAYPWFERFQGLADVFFGAAATYSVDRADGSANPGAGHSGATGDSDPQARVRLVTGNYFSVLGVNPHAGRTFTADDDRASGGHPVAVISYDYWERRFALASDIVGRTLALGGTQYTILGVTPRGFSGEWVGRPADLWIPLAMLPQLLTELPPGSHPRGGGLAYYVIARLKPGVSPRQAQAYGQVLYQQILREERAGSNPTPQLKQRIASARFEVEPAATGFSPQRESFGQPLAILSFVVALVLLIACANVANLLMTRSAARQKEMAVRLAIGAGRARLVRQLLTESVLLAALGGVAGLLFAHWGTKVLVKLAGSGLVWRADQQLILDLHPDIRIFAFAAVLCLFTGILFGLAPALRGTSFSPVLNERGNGHAGRFRLGKLLVAAQVALSLVLLIGAGLFVRTLHNLKSQDLGFDRERVLLVWTALRQSGRQPGAPTVQLFEMTQQRISALPGVVSASVSTGGVLHGSPSFPYPVKVQGHLSGAGETPMAQSDVVMPRFFETLGMRVILGRDFTSRDTETAPRVVIVNEAVSRHFFGDRSPIGKRIGFGYGVTGNELEIVGMVNDAIHIAPHDPGRMMFYVPYLQDVGHLHSMCITARTAGDPTTVAGSVRQELRNVDPNLPVLRINTIEGQLNDVLVRERLIATLSGFFGALAILLACIGLYGVMAYTTARRINEIGIRLALGATRSGVLGMVLKESLFLVLVGITIGVPSALAAAQLVSNRLFGVSATDPLTIAGAAGLMAAVAAFGGFLPARRASRVDPMLALRNE